MSLIRNRKHHMTDLPYIPHASVDPIDGGFVAKPLAYSAEAHAAFHQAVEDFEQSQGDWVIQLLHKGPFGPWDTVIFVPIR